MPVFIDIYRGMHEHFPARRSEWIMSLAMITWGLILAQPEEIFLRTPAWSAMAAIMTEMNWAIMTISVGTLRLIALIVNGTFAHTTLGRFSPHTRALASFCSCGVWFQILYGLIASGSQNTGLAMYSAALILDVLNVFAAMSDAGKIDGAKQNGSP